MYIGIDIIEINRISKLLDYEKSLLNIFTKNELDVANKLGAKRKIESLAGKFAAKEAAVKALGSGFNEFIHPNDIEILNNENGMPFMILHNRSLEYSKKMNIEKYKVSISHNKTTAAAVVVLL
ncbi:holo-ACP synthase [Neobacillus drentensis]|uniref:holo-ACP synthase n=1 Tax=Neobacillus drentensis TaxID=220684 RepID=UPI000826134D|nr:holo-ACP synthase [Neobacillus drentensis]